MKIKNIVGLLLLTAISTNLSSCSSEEDDTIINQETVNLTLEKDALNIPVGKSEEIKISKGNGDYKAFSLNPEIADIKIESGKILVEGKSNGKTTIFVSDQNNQFVKVAISSYYESITTNQEAMNIKMPIGNVKSATLTITAGNEGYTVTTDNNEIMSVSVSGNKIMIIGRKEGTGNITIKDALDLTKVVNVTITTTDIPYEESELNAIKENDAIRYSLLERVANNDDIDQNEFYNSIKNNVNLYGFNYYDWEYLKIYFSGDKTVGVKADSKLTCNWNNVTFNDQPIKFEIIKNDGKKIWAVYSCLKEGRLYYGYFCQNINAE